MTAARSACRHDLYEDMRPPIMVVDDTHAARFRGRATVEASGFDVLPELTPADALDALEQQSSLSAIWIELDETPSLAARRLLERADRESARRMVKVVVATPLEHIDDVLKDLPDGSVDLLVNANEAERIAALALVMARSDKSLRDVASDASAARLRQLSEEVSRIAATLARLSSASPDLPLVRNDGCSPMRPAGGFGRRLTCHDSGAAHAGGLPAGGPVCRSSLGYAARSAAGRDRSASSPRIEPVHRRRSACHNGAALDQGDDGAEPACAAQRPA